MNTVLLFSQEILNAVVFPVMKAADKSNVFRIISEKKLTGISSSLTEEKSEICIKTAKSIQNAKAATIWKNVIGITTIISVKCLSGIGLIAIATVFIAIPTRISTITTQESSTKFCL